jgi:hypothetical protein
MFCYQVRTLSQHADSLREPWCTGYALIDQFWFDVEPSYIEGHRKKGVKHDRCEFGARRAPWIAGLEGN